MLIFLLVFAVSFSATFISTPVLIRKFYDAGILGRDVHKEGKPAIPEMGGLAIVAGFVAGVLVAVALTTLARNLAGINSPFHVFTNLTEIFAGMSTILIIAIIGIFDDLVKMRHSIKALLPLFASFPLVAIAAGHPYITLPFLGEMYLPIIYPLILIPLAITTVSNLTNMLAGFNGLECGLGLVGCLSLGVIALDKGSMNAAILLFSMAGALFAFLFFNRFPARVLPGDVATLSIGACIASSVILGNFEMAGLFIVLPHLADFVLKVKNKFPREIDFTRLQNGKITSSKVVGLPSLITRLTGGISETRLVMSIVSIELICGVFAILIW